MQHTIAVLSSWLKDLNLKINAVKTQAIFIRSVTLPQLKLMSRYNHLPNLSKAYIGNRFTYGGSEFTIVCETYSPRLFGVFAAVTLTMNPC